MQHSAWSKYSTKLSKRILHPKYLGQIPSIPDGTQLFHGEEGDIMYGNHLVLQVLINTTDGTILDAKYKLFGETALLGALEGLIDCIIGKNYDQASRLTATLIDKEMRDKPNRPAFGQEAFSHINLALSALDDALNQCSHIPLPDNYVQTPISLDSGETTQYPNWETLSNKQKHLVIQEITLEKIEPYIKLDNGGIEILEVQDNLVKIAYQGACTTCPASATSTLSAIQQILRQFIHPALQVTPHLPVASEEE